MRCRSSLPLLLLAACAGAEPAAVSPPVVEMSASATPADQTEPDHATAEPLVRLLLRREHLRMIDCGHDDTVGELGCAFGASGTPRPLPDERVLRVYLTDPPGLVLAAGPLHPQRALADHPGHEVMVAECALSERGRLGDVALAATAGVPGWLYLGSLPVYGVSACDLSPYDALPQRLSAAHLLIAHDDARRKPPKVSRSRAAAIERARLAAKDLATNPDRPFGPIVTMYSDEQSAQARGGALGVFRPGAMAPEFELILLATPIGKRSAAFETTFGFHILERRAAAQAPSPAAPPTERAP